VKNDLVKQLPDVKASNGNVSAFIVLKGSPEENKMNGANIHSFLDLPK